MGFCGSTINGGVDRGRSVESPIIKSDVEGYPLLRSPCANSSDVSPSEVTDITEHASPKIPLEWLDVSEFLLVDDDALLSHLVCFDVPVFNIDRTSAIHGAHFTIRCYQSSIARIGRTFVRSDASRNILLISIHQ